MKKFTTLLLSLVLTVVCVLALVACEQNDGTIPGDYKEVDLTDEAQKSELIDSLAEKIQANAGDGQQSLVEQFLARTGWKLEAETGVKFNIDVDYMGTDTQASGDVTTKQSVSFVANVQQGQQPTFAAAGQVRVKGGLQLPAILFADVASELPVDQLLQALSDFDCSANVSTDGHMLYLDLSDDIVEFVESLGGQISSKLKIDLDSDIMPTAEEQQGDITAELKLQLGQIVELLQKYNVGIAVSTEDGWAVRLTASEQTLSSILADPDIIPPVYASILSSVNFAKCEAELYIAFDDNGLLKQVSSKANIEASISYSGDVTAPAVNGSVTLTATQQLTQFTGTVSLPDDKDYTELPPMPQLPQLPM